MTTELKDKLSRFIDDLIEHRWDKLIFNIHIHKKKIKYYSIDIDTEVIRKTNGLGFLTQTIHFCVCPENGFISLTRNDFADYIDEDIELANKFSEIIQSLYLRKQKEALDNIIDNSYIDLKLQRDSNIKELFKK